MPLAVAGTVLTTLGHPDGIETLRQSLVAELAQTGVADTTGQAYALASTAVLTYGWYGYIDEDIEPVWCTGTGMTINEDQVDRALPCVYALING